jgi:hypothetical protein
MDLQKYDISCIVFGLVLHNFTVAICGLGYTRYPL